MQDNELDILDKAENGESPTSHQGLIYYFACAEVIVTHGNYYFGYKLPNSKSSSPIYIIQSHGHVPHKLALTVTRHNASHDSRVMWSEKHSVLSQETSDKTWFLRQHREVAECTPRSHVMTVYRTSPETIIVSRSLVLVLEQGLKPHKSCRRPAWA